MGVASPAGVQVFAMGDALGNILPASNGGTQVGGTSGNVANAVAAATLAATVGKTNYLTFAEFTYAGATAAGIVVATITGLAGGTHSYVIAVPAGTTLPGTPLILAFAAPQPASAPNTAITFSVPALGAGNTNAAANVSGYQV